MKYSILLLTLISKCFAQLEEVEVSSDISDSVVSESFVPDSVVNDSFVPDSVVNDSFMPDSVVNDIAVTDGILNKNSVTKSILYNASTTDGILNEDEVTNSTISAEIVTETFSRQICSMCKCNERNKKDTGLTFEILCAGSEIRSDIPDLDKIEWPETNGTQKISVVFDGLGLTELRRLPTNHNIEELSFTNNAIVMTWPRAFSGLPNLKKLSLSQNNLTHISEDIFLHLEKLEELDLSYNKLTDSNNTDFSPLINLKTINLKYNSYTRVPIELSKVTNLEKIDLSKNLIFHLEFNEESTATYLLSNIKYLNLSGNKLSLIFKNTFYKADVLEYLDLSDSEIGHIEQEAFTHCPRLRELKLSHNRLISTFKMPKHLQTINLSHNSISKWPLFQDDIRNIDISFNQLVEYGEGYGSLNELQVLNIAGNDLDTYEIETVLPKLTLLDISNNQLQYVPSSISSTNLPSLEELRLDGNPIPTLRFKSEIALKKLHLNYLNNIVQIEENAFAKIRGREFLDDSQETVVVNTECVEVFISHCEHLSNIDDLAFFGVPLCKLDISYNNLTSLSKDLTSWEELKLGTDLQGNPWRCDCGLQWVLDELLPVLYVYQPELLHNLKCETPRGLQGQRLVHWYNWGRSPLCDESNRSRQFGDYVMYESSEGSSSKIFGADTTQVLLIIAVITGLIIIVGLIAYLVFGTRDRNYQIRQAMLKKRQTVADAMYENERTKGQVTALTKV